MVYLSFDQTKLSSIRKGIEDVIDDNFDDIHEVIADVEDMIRDVENWDPQVPNYKQKLEDVLLYLNQSVERGAEYIDNDPSLWGNEDPEKWVINTYTADDVIEIAGESMIGRYER